MKLYSVLAILSAITVCCKGYSFVIPAKIGLPGVCMYHGLMLKKGDNSLPSSCQNMHCNEDGSILVEGCGHHDMTDCRVIDPLNLDKPYPDCCKMNFLCSTASGGIVNREVLPVERKVYAQKNSLLDILNPHISIDIL